MEEGPELKKALAAVLGTVPENAPYSVTFAAAGENVSYYMQEEDLRDYFEWKAALLLNGAEPTIFCYVGFREGIRDISALIGEDVSVSETVEMPDGVWEVMLLFSADTEYRVMYAFNREKHRGAALFDREDMGGIIACSMMMAPLLAMATASEDLCLIHSAGVASEDGGAMMIGYSGAGKTTLSCACLKHGMDYLSDDTLYIAPKEGLMYPVESAVHPDTDVLKLLGYGFGRSFKLDPGKSFKKHFDLSLCEDRFLKCSPVKAVIVLKDRSAEPSAERIRPMAAAAMLITSSSRILGSTEHYRNALGNAAKMIASLPVYGFSAGQDMKKNAEYIHNIIKGVN